ncbi:Protein of unknown function [Cotesia congregata]|uniref:Uncharacterized protein n=1 Tax=Cotesia congregata TaxID=51543 RepID=A0A8J2MVR5_COTCN|nr:Protein of unknown function [Cotesia congregata]
MTSASACLISDAMFDRTALLLFSLPLFLSSSLLRGSTPTPVDSKAKDDAELNAPPTPRGSDRTAYPYQLEQPLPVGGKIYPMTAAEGTNTPKNMSPYSLCQLKTANFRGLNHLGPLSRFKEIFDIDESNKGLGSEG